MDASAELTIRVKRELWTHHKPKVISSSETGQRVPIVRFGDTEPFKFAEVDDVWVGRKPVNTWHLTFTVDPHKLKTVGLQFDVGGSCPPVQGVVKPGGPVLTVPFTPNWTADGNGNCTLRMRLCAIPGTLQTRDNACPA